ncbi:hypothetical protein QFZ32_009294 [Streptomyces canus]|uniref:Uncharacterized protein n=1 Tax=Streptomyces canus TaxID=58343 RepID=A0AAW8FU59_9ACTN|nr:hypothetical protein [Streptomyces canus]MDQ1073766.1 hypothetical protein [Streptomyces canus]
MWSRAKGLPSTSPVRCPGPLIQSDQGLTDRQAADVCGTESTALCGRAVTGSPGYSLEARRDLGL